MEHKCMNCGSTSEDKVLLSCEYKGEELHVCKVSARPYSWSTLNNTCPEF